MPNPPINVYIFRHNKTQSRYWSDQWAPDSFDIIHNSEIEKHVELSKKAGMIVHRHEPDNDDGSKYECNCVEVP